MKCEEFPVNRMFTVDAGYPTPNLSCVVGFQSIESEDLFRTDCSQAHNYALNISRGIRKRLKWPMEKRTLRCVLDINVKLHISAQLRFGYQPNGQPWPGTAASWVCSTVPQAGTVTFDCVPEVGWVRCII